MTAARPRRSRSPCQSGTGWPPARVTARAASTSSSDPGKVMTPTRAVMSVLAAGERGEVCLQITVPAGLSRRAPPLASRLSGVPELAFGQLLGLLRHADL